MDLDTTIVSYQPTEVGGFLLRRSPPGEEKSLTGLTQSPPAFENTGFSAREWIIKVMDGRYSTHCILKVIHIGEEAVFDVDWVDVRDVDLSHPWKEFNDSG